MKKAPITHSAASAIWPGDFSVSAIRTTLASTPFSVRTSVVIAKRDDQNACGNADPFPADIFLEAALERGQQSMHSSSRRGGDSLEADCERKRSREAVPTLHERRHTGKILGATPFDKREIRL